MNALANFYFKMAVKFNINTRTKAIVADLICWLVFFAVVFTVLAIAK